MSSTGQISRKVVPQCPTVDVEARYRYAQKQHQALRNDYGPKVKIRKLPPLQRHPDGRIIKRRSKSTIPAVLLFNHF